MPQTMFVFATPAGLVVVPGTTLQQTQAKVAKDLRTTENRIEWLGVVKAQVQQ